jgi:predicted DCC family thiol-disulfide oxidoreductase YuxK
VAGAGEISRTEGWVFYDGACSLCTGLARRVRRRLERCGFELVPLQAPGVREILGVRSEELMTQMWVLTQDGHVLGGADAALYLARRMRRTWWGLLLITMSKLPHGMALIGSVYKWVASHRYSFGGRCALVKFSGGWPPSHEPPAAPEAGGPSEGIAEKVQNERSHQAAQ